jgi:hypothetical protein
MKKLLLTALSVFGIFFICRAQIMEAEDDTYGGFQCWNILRHQMLTILTE